MTTLVLPIAAVTFIKEFYPRLREDDAAIERYRAALDRLPPLVVARGHILVDGFHRWMAHQREGTAEVLVDDLGNLSDLEIRKESLRRNAAHGHQLEERDKRTQAGEMFLLGVDEAELAELLSVSARTLERYLKDAKATATARRKAELWDRWLNCEFSSYRQAGDAYEIDHKTAAEWIGEFQTSVENSPPGATRDEPWGHVQHFDIWNFQAADGESKYFGKMPPQVVENLLWLFTEPGDIVMDPFVGGGTTIDVAKAMGRRVWASDRKPSTPLLPIHAHDLLDGWPTAAPRKADLILLDPPYWQQAAGRYSDDPQDLANMDLDAFMAAWATIVKTCAAHLEPGGRLAYIISPTQLDKAANHAVVDHATAMLAACWAQGLTVERRIIVPYQTQQATGQQVEWARKERKLLKLYRDLVVLTA